MRKLTKNTDIYAIRDKIVRAYLKILLRKFKQMNQKSVLGFDEVNALQGVSTDFNDIVDTSVKALREVAQKTYKWLTGDDEDMLIDMWLSGWLQEVNPVTLYKWYDEAERKRGRLLETLIGSKTSAQRKKEIDIAMRYWVRQFEQFADCVVSEMLSRAIKKAGYKYVEWNTERDARVCPDCHARQGKIYPVKSMDLIPLHYNCRCWWIPVK